MLADRTSPAYLAGASDAMAGVWAAADFVAGNGFAWHNHDPRIFSGTEELFRPTYEALLASAWIPALDGVEAKLQAGARVADVGCGHGVSTVVMAAAYPASAMTGFDAHDASIATARDRAAASGVSGNTRFEVACADRLPGSGFDLVCFSTRCTTWAIPSVRWWRPVRRWPKAAR